MFEGPVTWAAASFLLGACIATAGGAIVAVIYINNIRRDIDDKIVAALLKMTSHATREDFSQHKREIFARMDTQWNAVTEAQSKILREVGELKGRVSLLNGFSREREPR